MGGTTRPFEVLHVDDELDFAAMTAEYLESQIETVSVETAPSAKDCLEKLTANKFDCVVIDYALPRMNGIELLETVGSAYHICMINIAQIGGLRGPQIAVER